MTRTAPSARTPGAARPACQACPPRARRRARWNRCCDAQPVPWHPKLVSAQRLVGVLLHQTRLSSFSSDSAGNHPSCQADRLAKGDKQRIESTRAAAAHAYYSSFTFQPCISERSRRLVRVWIRAVTAWCHFPLACGPLSVHGHCQGPCYRQSMFVTLFQCSMQPHPLAELTRSNRARQNREAMAAEAEAKLLAECTFKPRLLTRSRSPASSSQNRDPVSRPQPHNP